MSHVDWIFFNDLTEVADVYSPNTKTLSIQTCWWEPKGCNHTTVEAKIWGKSRWRLVRVVWWIECWVGSTAPSHYRQSSGNVFWTGVAEKTRCVVVDLSWNGSGVNDGVKCLPAMIKYIVACLDCAKWFLIVQFIALNTMATANTVTTAYFNHIRWKDTSQCGPQVNVKRRSPKVKP